MSVERLVPESKEVHSEDSVAESVTQGHDA